MGKTRWMTGSLVSLGLLMGSVTTAEARPRYGYDRGHDRGWHHRHRGDGFGFGDAVGVAALVGAVAIVASSMSKDKKAAQTTGGTPNDHDYVGTDTDYGDTPPPADGTDYGADVGRDTAPTRSDDFSDVASASGTDRMTDACAVAARDEAQGQAGGYAEVRHLDEPRPANGGYNIDGEVETRASYRATSGTTRRFTCSMQDGRVAEVYLSRDVVMR